MHVIFLFAFYFCSTFCCTKIEFDTEKEVLCCQGNMSFDENGVVVFSTDKLEYPCEASIGVGDKEWSVLGCVIGLILCFVARLCVFPALIALIIKCRY